jgi:dihydrofolate reductase
VFILTHHERPSIEFPNGTSFHFVDAPPDEALHLARKAANGRDVRIGGGPSTVRQFLHANLVDFMHLAIVPITLGRGVVERVHHRPADVSCPPGRSRARSLNGLATVLVPR